MLCQLKILRDSFSRTILRFVEGRRMACWWYAHLCELRGRTAGDLLNAQLTQLSLQLAELLLQVLLVLAPESTGLDFSGLLQCTLAPHYNSISQYPRSIFTIFNECRGRVVEMVVIV
jgi:hypothetical protein